MSVQCCRIPLPLNYSFPIVLFSNEVLSYHTELENQVGWHTSKRCSEMEPDI